MARRILLYLAFLLFTPALFSQEVTTGLQSNIMLQSPNLSKPEVKGLSADTLSLPFFDDFSRNSISPDQGKWSDNFIFINDTYSSAQITKGVATFDVLDNYGNLYETASPSVFAADRLTSKPVDLNFAPGSAIYFSFLYEAGGLSDPPEANDSLTLQFYAPAERTWYSVWRMAGKPETGFRNVIIPVDQPRFLRKGFRFRFMNYASLSRNLNDPSMLGNCDIWNIDYVRLNTGRSPSDTISNDVAFRLPLRSLLQDYESMPWKQFLQVYLQEMGGYIPVNYRNNDVIVRNVTRDFEIRDVYQNVKSHSFTAGAVNVDPQVNTNYDASLIYTFGSSNPDSALFKITCSLKTDEFDPKVNDTLVYYQVFSNYFAYDDGSSEGGYGINGLGSRNAMFACRFKSFIPDSLRAVRICFNDSYLDANQRMFDLMIWSDNNGTPGNLLYSIEEEMVEAGSRINGFYTYRLPVALPVNGNFYVGWKQRSETFLNAGYDINTSPKDRQFYWLNGSWNPSQVNGAVMIRPVLGSKLLTGIEKDQEILSGKVKIWPNPAKDQIRMNINERPYSSSAFISVIDMSGHEVMKVPFTETLDISRLSNGVYIVVTVVDGRRIGYNRLIKSR